VLVRAEHQTTGQLRASLQRAVLAADPAAAERRRQEAQRRAWVALFGDHDGTASLSGRLLPAAQAAAAWARICAMAKAMEAAGAGGGMDLLRAQVFVGLLLGTLPLIPPSDGGPEDAGPGDGGLETCPCNLSPECSRHHHLKHLPSWRLDQPRPGVLAWTTPARLTHTVTSGPYPV
jgi:hypothetical protein